MVFVAVLFLSVIVSLDALAVGFTYGCRGLRVSTGALVVVGLVSGLVVLISMGAGSLIRSVLPPTVMKLIGSLAFLVLGAYLIVSTAVKRAGEHHSSPRQLFEMRLKTMGLVVSVWFDPMVADTDKSGSVSAPESAALGVALALDALGAGLAAGLSGLPIALLPPFVAVMTLGMLWFGSLVGRRLSKVSNRDWIDWIPGVLMVCLAFLEHWL